MENIFLERACRLELVSRTRCCCFVPITQRHWTWKRDGVDASGLRHGISCVVGMLPTEQCALYHALHLCNFPLSQDVQKARKRGAVGRWVWLLSLLHFTSKICSLLSPSPGRGGSAGLAMKQSIPLAANMTVIFLCRRLRLYHGHFYISRKGGIVLKTINCSQGICSAPTLWGQQWHLWWRHK